MKKYITTLILIISFSVLNYAQFGTSSGVDARSMGMAKTYNATSEGVYSIGINPANLMFMKHSVEISTVLPLPFLTLRSGTNFVSIDDINYFFGRVNGKPRYLSNSDKKRFEDLFKNGGFVLANLGMNLFSLSINTGKNIGAFAFSINDVVSARFDFPKALIEIALTGNPIGKEYNLNDAKAKAWWIRDYSFSYAKSFKNVLPNIFDNFSAGVTFKYVNGYAYVATDTVSTTFSTKADGTITGNAGFRAVTSFSKNFGVKYDFQNQTTANSSGFSPFPSPAGTGFGFDLGLAASMDHVWRFALSVTDIGNMKWTNNDAQFTASGKISINNITDTSQTNELKNKIQGKSSNLVEFTTDLPTAFRLGVSYYFDRSHNLIPGTLLLAFDYNQGFNNAPGNSKNPRISFGAEWKPGDWIPFIRTGISFGGIFGFHWGLGLGFNAGPLEFNFATSDFQAVIAPNSARYLSIAFGSRWKF